MLLENTFLETSQCNVEIYQVLHNQSNKCLQHKSTILKPKNLLTNVKTKISKQYHLGMSINTSHIIFQLLFRCTKQVTLRLLWKQQNYIILLILIIFYENIQCFVFLMLILLSQISAGPNLRIKKLLIKEGIMIHLLLFDHRALVQPLIFSLKWQYLSF